MKGEEQKTGGVAYAGVSSRVDIEYCIHWSRLGASRSKRSRNVI